MIGTPLKVKDAISEIDRKEIQLPEGQRSYVWKKSQVAKLLDSLYQRYPVGSILLWDTQEGVRLRQLEIPREGGKAADFAPKIILDGQQRLTSLARVFDPKTEVTDRILFNIDREVFEPYSGRNAVDPLWIDVTDFLSRKTDELSILDRLVEAGGLIQKDPRRKSYHDRLKSLAAIADLQFPIEIVRDDLETATEIFIRVNSAGTRLRQAELALAKLAWKIPGMISDQLYQTEEDLEARGFDLDTPFLMRCLIADATHQTRFKGLKAFWERPVATVEAEWTRTRKGILAALDFVERNVGIPGSDLLPSHASLIPLTYVFTNRQFLQSAEERLLRRWFIVANAFSRYVGKTETTLNEDLKALGPGVSGIQLLHDLCLEELRTEPRVKPEDLDGAGDRSPFFCLAFLAIMKRQPMDWFDQVRIGGGSSADDHKIELHHIFPKALLNRMGVDHHLRDEMANIAILGRRANRRIRQTSPEEYLPDVVGRGKELLGAQLVPTDPALWKPDAFKDFLAARRRLLADAMNDILKA